MPSAIDTVIFDLGGVLIAWNPRYLYRRLFDGDEAAMEHFLTHVCSPEWNHAQDAGRRFADAEAEAIARHPDKRALIEAWRLQFDEMIPGAFEDSVTILDEVRQRGLPLYALTNWAEETFASQPGRFPFLGWFKGIVVSGTEGVAKPDPRIFRLLLDRYGIDAARAVFIDDVPRNVEAARSVGLQTIAFTDPAALRRSLQDLGVL